MQRLDKWLWCARLVKTRTLGAKLIEAGKIRVNGERMVKASRQVHAGDVITAAKPGRLFIVRVLASAERRASPPLARLLYEDLTPPKAKAEPDGAAASTPGGPRPTKRARRRLDAFLGDEV